MVETQTFENNYVTVLDSSKCVCSQQRWYCCQSLLRFYVVGQKDATCGHGLERTRRFQTKTDVCRQNLDLQRHRGITYGIVISLSA